MTKLASLQIIIFLLFSSFVNGQDAEQEIIQAIENIIINLDINQPYTQQLKALKKIANTNTKDYQFSAVTHAIIGKSLNEKGFYKEAYSYLKKAYSYRKKQGQFKPQKWALSALINHGMSRKDYKQVLKFMRIWIDLVETNRTESTLDTYSVFELLLNNLSPTEWGYMKETSPEWQMRRKYGHKLIKYFLKKYPQYREKVFHYQLENRMTYYPYLVERNLGKNIELARYWEKQGLKLAKRYKSSSEYIHYVRYFTTLYNGTEDWFTGKSEPSKHEADGHRLILKYIEICKKIKKHDQVTFGHRYISTRKRINGYYKEAIHALADALKYCRKHNLSEIELEKAIKGIHPIIDILKENKDQKGLDTCKKWKEDYDLKGLNSEDIQRIDNLIQAIELTEIEK